MKMSEEELHQIQVRRCSVRKGYTMAVAHKIASDMNSKQKGVSPYKCKVCDQWHLCARRTNEVVKCLKAYRRAQEQKDVGV